MIGPATDTPILSVGGLQTLLQLAAVMQLVIASLNLALTRMMGWKEDLDRLPLLIREVHQVHSWFVSLTLGIFAVLTWRFAPEMAGGADPVGCWLGGGIGIFWAVRTVLQVTYYSTSHWQGNFQRTLIHVTLLIVYYGGCAVSYLWAAFGGAAVK